MDLGHWGMISFLACSAFKSNRKLSRVRKGMNELTKLIKSDMKPALGVTEPGAIAFAVAKARSYTRGEVTKVRLVLNSGMYKNAFSCGIPNSEAVGNVFSAALGAVAGDSQKELMVLEDITEKDNVMAQEMIDAGKIEVVLGEVTPVIFIEATVTTTLDTCVVTIQNRHTNITRIVKNDEVVFEAPVAKSEKNAQGGAVIHHYSLKDLHAYASTVPLEEILFINDAFIMNKALFNEALENSRTAFTKQLLKGNQGKIISDNAVDTAQLLCNATIEARVIGLSKPAMSITGSGAHGIIATMPLYAVAQVKGYSKEILLRATALSYLITMYIKEHSGALSALCGCAVAAGTGMACGLAYMQGASVKELTLTIQNMASSITGMICDGGNQGCTMKGVVGVDAAFRAVQFALNGVAVDTVHGINGPTAEETMRNIGLVASPGMVQTEKTIVKIFEQKLGKV